MGTIIAIGVASGACSTPAPERGPEAVQKEATRGEARQALHDFDERAFFLVEHDELFLRSRPLRVSYPEAQYVPLGELSSEGAPAERALVTAVIVTRGEKGEEQVVLDYLRRMILEHDYLRIAASSLEERPLEGPLSLEEVPMVFVNGIAVHGADIWALERAIRGQARGAHIYYLKTGATGDDLYEAMSMLNAAGYGEAIGEARGLDEACEEGTLTSCVASGRGWAQGRQDRMDWERALMQWEKACAGGVLEACLEEALFLIKIGSDGDLMGRFGTMFREACEEGQGKACGVYGIIGAGMFVNEAALDAVLPFVEKGCELDDGQSCTLLGQVYLYGIGRNAQFAKGARALEKACELGDGEGCMHAAAAMPDHMPRNRVRIRDRYERACIAGTPGACVLLGNALKSGPPTTSREGSWIRTLYRQDCRGPELNALCLELKEFVDGL